MAKKNYMTTPPVFIDENYHICAVKMEAFSQANNIWNLVKTEELPAHEDPTTAQIRNQGHEKTRRCKAKTCIHLTVSYSIFTKIISYETAKQAWDLLKEEYQGNAKTKKINLRREFEMQKIKETEEINDYTDRLMVVVNKIRFLGEKLPNRRVVEKSWQLFLNILRPRFHHLKGPGICQQSPWKH